MHSKGFVALIFLSIACCCNGVLYGIWDDVFGGQYLQFWTIDEKIGNKTKLIYTNEDYLTIFGYPITADRKNQIVYMPLMNATDLSSLKSHLVGFDVSDQSNIHVTTSVDVPFDLVMTIYDASTNLIYVGGNRIINPGENETVTPIIIGVVDPVKQTYKQLLEFPQESYYLLWPTPGSAATIDEKNQLLVMSMMQNLNTGSHFRTVTVDLNTLTIRIVNQTTYYAQALSWNPLDGKVYALISLININSAASLNTSWAYVDEETLAYNVISTWQNEFLIFVIQGIITTDFTNQVGYSIIGDGGGPPVAFVSWDTVSGKLLSFGVYDDQPQFIVVV